MRRPMLVALVALLEVACGRLGQYTSLAIGGDGRGLVSYQDGPDGTLRVAHCEDGPCTRATVNTLDRPFDRGGVQISVGPNTSLAIGRDGLGLISYEGDGLAVAHCQDLACTRATIMDVDSRAGVLSSNSLAIGRDGLALITYAFSGSNGSMLIAHCEDLECAAVTLSTLGGDMGTSREGSSASLAIGTDGLGLIAYPNSGQSWDGARRQWAGASQLRGQLARQATRWVAAGASIVGGCCRVTPADIAVISQAVAAGRPGC